MGYRKLIIAAFAAGVIVSCASVSAMADTGWQQNDDGYWRYYTSDNEYVSNAWKIVDGNWYYFDQEGFAFTDKWVYISGKLYHFDSNGHMEKNKWVDCGAYEITSDEEKYAKNNPEYKKVLEEYRNKREWRYVGSDGAAYIGWKKVDGEWYYFNDFEAGHIVDGTYYFGDPNNYGLMHYGWIMMDDDTLYHFDGNGHYRRNCWYKGAFLYGETAWYYFGSDGKAVKGWKNIDGKWYCLGESWSYYPKMDTGKLFASYPNTGLWMLNDNGQLITDSGWHKSVNGKGKVTWQYIRSGGSLYQEEWLNEGGKWYYFDSVGNMVANTTYLIDGKEYSFNSSGVCTNAGNPKKISGWYKMEFEKYWYRDDIDVDYSDYAVDYWVYVGKDGKLLKEQWLNDKGNWYYFYDNGIMLSSYDSYLLDGKLYSFDENGKCTDHTPSFSNGWNKYYAYGEEEWIYLENGKVCTGWKKINNNWYYFEESNGFMATGDAYIDGNGYLFDENGLMTYGWYYNGHSWHYYRADGTEYTGWLKYNGSWYYFREAGDMVNWHGIVIDGKVYNFNSDGKCLNPSGDGILILSQYSQNII